jgi:hypothetical protein
MEIYVLINNEPQGPYTRELIRAYLKSGQLRPADLAAYAGRADWKPLSVLAQSWGAGTAQSSPASAKRRPIVMVIASTAALLIIAGGFVFWTMHHKTTGGGVAYSERDLPKTLAELNTWYVEPAEGQNAATYFAKGFEQFEITDADQKSKDLPIIGAASWPPPGTPLSARARASITAFVQRNDTAWSALEQGVSFEQARYPIDLNRGPETLLPHLAKIKKTAQFAQLKAALYAEENQPKAAADTLLVSLSVAESLKDEPVLISQLVRVADHAIGVATLEGMMNSVALSPDDLERLSAAFAKVELSQTSGEGFTRALVGERVMSLSLFDLPPDKLQAVIKADQRQNNLSDAAIGKMLENLTAQRAFAEDTFDHALTLRRKAFPERMQVDQYFSARANEATTRYPLCQLLLSSMGKSTEREAKGIANLRLARTAIALERYRREHGGSYPDSLSALVPKFLPEIPVDPVKGDAINYQKSGEGYELTSSPINSPKPLSFKVGTPPKPV